MSKGKQSRYEDDATGHNNPKKSTVIITGTYKKKQTTEKQIKEHEDPHKIAQEAKVHPEREGLSKLPRKANSREQAELGEKRDGSDSNAHKGRKRSRLHEDHRSQNDPQPYHSTTEVAHDLNPNELGGQHHYMGGLTPAPTLRSAYDFKELHSQLSDLSNDELRQVEILAEGSHLEQGAKYLDLRHPEQGEFIASAHMVAGLDNLYVPKRNVDYLIWNHLIGVTMLARLDESETVDQ